MVSGDQPGRPRQRCGQIDGQGLIGTVVAQFGPKQSLHSREPNVGHLAKQRLDPLQFPLNHSGVLCPAAVATARPAGQVVAQQPRADEPGDPVATPGVAALTPSDRFPGHRGSVPAARSVVSVS
jgi:hypothetical protein